MDSKEIVEMNSSLESSKLSKNESELEKKDSGNNSSGQDKNENQEIDKSKNAVNEANQNTSLQQGNKVIKQQTQVIQNNDNNQSPKPKPIVIGRRLASSMRYNLKPPIKQSLKRNLQPNITKSSIIGKNTELNVNHKTQEKNESLEIPNEIINSNESTLINAQNIEAISKPDNESSKDDQDGKEGVNQTKSIQEDQNKTLEQKVNQNNDNNQSSKSKPIVIGRRLASAIKVNINSYTKEPLEFNTKAKSKMPIVLSINTENNINKEANENSGSFEKKTQNNSIQEEQTNVSKPQIIQNDDNNDNPVKIDPLNDIQSQNLNQKTPNLALNDEKQSSKISIHPKLSYNFYIVDSLFNNLIHQLQNEALKEKYMKTFKNIKANPDQNLNSRLLSLFKKMLKVLIIRKSEQKQILNTLNKWCSENIKKDLPKLDHPKTSLNDHQFEILDSWKNEIEKNIKYNEVLNELQKDINNNLRTRKEKVHAFTKNSFKVGGQNVSYTAEKRYSKFIFDMMFVADTLNADLQEGNYIPPSWS